MRKQLDKAAHKIEEFVDAGGKKRKSFVFPLATLGELPLPCNLEWDRYHESELNHSIESKFIPHGFKNMAHAHQTVQDFRMPDEILVEAKRLSRHLMWALTENRAPSWRNRQTDGRFDVRSMARITRDLKAGTFSLEHTRPMVKRQRKAPTRPHVGIIANGSWPAMWGDPMYIPNIGIITLSVAWACEALNCAVTSALTRNLMGDLCKIGDGTVGVLPLIDEDTFVTLNQYACIFHRELYRMGNITMHTSHCDTLRDFRGLHGKSDEEVKRNGSGYGGGIERADSGGHGVSWAKYRGATVTVAIGGNILDSKHADIHVKEVKNPEQVVMEIAKQMLSKHAEIFNDKAA